MQKEKPDVSSKMAFKGFMDNTPFMELKLICEHIPKWLKTYETHEIIEEKHHDKIVATKRRKQCRREGD